MLHCASSSLDPSVNSSWVCLPPPTLWRPIGCHRDREREDHHDYESIKEESEKFTATHAAIQHTTRVEIVGLLSGGAHYNAAQDRDSTELNHRDLATAPQEDLPRLDLFRASLEGVPIHEIDEIRTVTRTVHTNIRGRDDSDDSDNSICDWSYMFIPQPCYDYIQPHEDDEYDTDEYDIDKSEMALDHRTYDEERDPMRD